MRLTDFFAAALPGGFKRRMRLDVLLAVLAVFVMADRLTGNPVHEAASVVLALLFAVHLRINKESVVRLTKPPRRPSVVTRVKRLATLFAAVLALIALLAATVSGIVVSQSLFAQLTPQAWQSDLDLRALHVTAGVAFLFAAGLHAGVHAELLVDFLTKHRLVRSLFAAVSAACFVFAWPRLAARDIEGIVHAWSAYIPVERDEFSLLLVCDFVIWFLAAAFVAWTMKMLFSKLTSKI